MSTDLICQVYNVAPEQLFIKKRNQNIVIARHIFFALNIYKTSFLEPRPTGYNQLTKLTGYDRATIINSIKKVNNLYTTDKNFHSLLNLILSVNNLTIEFQYFQTIAKFLN